MKILFSPSEGKIIPNGDLRVFDLESLESNGVSLAVKEAVEEYIAFLQSGAESEIATLFGTKKLDLDELALAQNCLNAPCVEAVRLYNGVGYKALDFESLDSQAKSYVREHLYIFSNLFGMLRADTPLPYYNLHQGKGKGTFALKALYKNLKPSIDEILENSEVLDLRAEAYLKVYQVEKCKHYTQVMFLKNGKRVSHYAKHYRGIYARVVAQKGLDSTKELEHLEIAGLVLSEVKHGKNATILTYEVVS